MLWRLAWAQAVRPLSLLVGPLVELLPRRACTWVSALQEEGGAAAADPPQTWSAALRISTQLDAETAKRRAAEAASAEARSAVATLEARCKGLQAQLTEAQDAYRTLREQLPPQNSEVSAAVEEQEAVKQDALFDPHKHAKVLRFISDHLSRLFYYDI